MIKNEHKYTDTWKKYSAKMLRFLESDKENDSFQLNPNDFTNVGDREDSGYGFNLVLNNCKVINNIEGSAVARDLRDYLVTKQFYNKLLRNKKVQINLNAKFQLLMKQEVLDEPMENNQASSAKH